jgi:D-psicose/D-tagatose/L-ribulose 3-epimerase
MKYGINTFLFTSPFTNDSTTMFASYKKWGFDSVEIPIEDPSHIDPSYVKAQLDAHGLVCGSICGCMGPDRDLRGTLQQQETALSYLMAVIDQMKPLGSTVLCGPLYSSVGRADAVPPAEYKQQWKTVVKHLKKLAKAAEKKGVVLAIEPLNRFET